MADPAHELALLAALRPAGEADMLADLFTPREGALTLLAKGLAKPGSHMAARLKPADELRIAQTRRRAGWPLLTGAEPEQLHPAWQADLGHLALYWFMLECARLGSGEPEQNAAVFRLLVNLLRSEPAAADLPGCACVFALKLLGLHGLLPPLGHCQLDGHAFAPDEPVFLLASGEGLLGYAAYQAHYARASGLGAPGLGPLGGLLPISPVRRRRWQELLHGALLDYPQPGADRADAAALLRLGATALADLAHQPVRSLEFLWQQWRLPLGRELTEMLAGG
jgi:recombinational DNA repair protein (RecF pathway)